MSIRRAEGTPAFSPLWMRFEHGHVKMSLAHYVSWQFDDEASGEYRVCAYLLRGLWAPNANEYSVKNPARAYTQAD